MSNAIHFIRMRHCYSPKQWFTYIQQDGFLTPSMDMNTAHDNIHSCTS